MTNFKSIEELYQNYFLGIYSGDVERLRRVFHPKAILIGDVNGEPYYKSVEEYLEIVKNRVSPKELGEDFLMKPLSFEVLEKIAFVKVHCPIFGFNYYDFLSLIMLDGRWLIASKVFFDNQGSEKANESRTALES